MPTRPHLERRPGNVSAVVVRFFREDGVCGLTPTEYEHYVADLLGTEGWEPQVSASHGDFGLDIVGERPGRTLGVQVKMYGRANRAVNAQVIMQLFGAAKYQDCTDVLLVTDGRVLDSAVTVADKLGIEIRHVPIPLGDNSQRSSLNRDARKGVWTFDRVWEAQVIPLEGQVLTRDNGSTNEVLAADWGGLTRRTSNGAVQTIEIEVFRWAIERLLDGEVVLREEINDQYPKRASSGIVLILGSLAIFEQVKVGSKIGLRAKGQE